MATYKSIAYGNIGVLANASGEVLLSSLTASSSSTLDFTSSIDSTYNIYKFRFVNIHSSATAELRFQGNAAGGSGFALSL